MFDLMNKIHLKRAISPVSVADNTAQVSQIIDRAGYDSVAFAILTGDIADADATFAVTLEHGDAANLSDAAAVDAADIIGTLTLAGFRFDDDNEPRKFGYKGLKRYLRATITPTANASAALLSMLAVLGNPSGGTPANPPV